LIDGGSHLRVVAIGLDAQRIKGRLARAGLVLERGASVRVYGKVHIYLRRGTVELRAIDIDTAMGVGDAETQRRRTLEVIHKLGLAYRQRGLATPVAPLRVGIVTPGGQGWEDFVARMRMTPWAWDLRVFFSPSEGPRAAESVGRAVRTLSAQIDVLVITRGGGSGATAAYDSPSVALSVCQSSCPVIVAVGHASDTTVAEQVAWRRESTPTAAAVILDRMLAIQKDDLAKEMTGAVDDAEQLVRTASRELEGEWTGFRLDVERYAAHSARAHTPVGDSAPPAGLSASGWRLVALVVVLLLAVGAVLAVLL
jgi:exodeoxyribonuclease VII large subunit